MNTDLQDQKTAVGNTENSTRRQGRWRKAVWAAAACLWLLPMFAMQFTTEVKWDQIDFIVWGVMLLAAAGAYELAVLMTHNTTYRIAVGISVVATFLLVWITLAVGVIGTADNPANLLCLGVLAVGISGVLIARFRPSGMALAMVATALAQTLVAVIALTAGLGHTFFLTGIFVALWLTSAHLFRRAALITP